MILVQWIIDGVNAVLMAAVLVLAYAVVTKNQRPIVRRRMILHIAITLTGMLAAEVAAMLFLQDPPGQVSTDLMFCGAVAGAFVGAGLGAVIVPVYQAKPRWRAPITVVVICALGAGVGGVQGWPLGELDAPPQICTAEERMHVIRAWIGIASAAGATVGLLLGAIYVAMRGRYIFPGITGELGEKPHDQPR